MLYRVIQTIQSPREVVRGIYNPPKEISFYKGDNLAQAVVALAQAAVQGNDPWFTIIGVRMEMAEPLTPHTESGKVQA